MQNKSEFFCQIWQESQRINVNVKVMIYAVAILGQFHEKSRECMHSVEITEIYSNSFLTKIS